jgi:hypothetical protein
MEPEPRLQIELISAEEGGSAVQIITLDGDLELRRISRCCFVA